MLVEIVAELDQGRVQVQAVDEPDAMGKPLAVQWMTEADDPERTVVLTGYTPTTATGFAFAGKLNVYGVSTLASNLQGSRSGGLMGSWLTRQGVLGIRIHGDSPTPALLVIDPDGDARLEPLSRYGTGLVGTSQLARAVYAEHGRDVALALTDPSSTGFAYTAVVCNSHRGERPTRAAGRATTRLGHNGLVGVVVAKAPQPRHLPATELSAVRRLQAAMARARRNPNLVGSDDVESPLLGGTYGAAARARLEQGHGLTNLFRDAHVPAEIFPTLLPDHLVREQLRRASHSGLALKRTSCLPGCPNRCAQTTLVSDGRGGWKAVKAGEWETYQGLLNLGVFEGVAETSAWVLEHSNDRAYDHIEALVTLAALALATEAGADTGVRYGDRESVRSALVQAAAGDTDLGRLVRRGARAVEREHGLERQFTVGGHALPFHNGRSMVQTGIGLSWTYGRHGESCAGPGRHNVLGEPYDPSDHGLDPEVHVLNTVHGMVLYGALDALDHCFFMGPSLQTLVDLSLIYEQLGSRLDVRQVLRDAARTIQAVHAFNTGRGVHIEPLPRVFYERPTRGNLHSDDQAVAFDVPFDVIRDHGAQVLDDLATGRTSVPGPLLDELERQARARWLG